LCIGGLQRADIFALHGDLTHMRWTFWRRDPDPMPSPDGEQWERALINRMAREFLHEQRRSRFWRNLLKVLGLLYLAVLLAGVYSKDLIEQLEPNQDHTALIEVKGIISSETQASADNLITALREAFEADHVKGVILRINSPGGSPVQAGYVNDEIRRLKAKYKKDNGRDLPVYAVAADLCASGGYYIAVAADKIYADKGSLVGSIGVRVDAFGFQKAMEDLGVERRLLTAGSNKGILDPFSPLSEQDRAFVQTILNTLHTQFIQVVKDGRGDRLKGDEEVFSGLFWSGEQALGLGLIDGLGSSSYVARELIGAETIVGYTKKKDLLEGLAERFGAGASAALLRVFDSAGAPALK
jgi:protease IV